jgi:hypothetical protein
MTHTHSGGLLWTRDRPVAETCTCTTLRLTCWVTKATKTHLEYVILVSHCNNGRTNAPQCYMYIAFIYILQGPVTINNLNATTVFTVADKVLLLCKTAGKVWNKEFNTMWAQFQAENVGS